MIVALTLALVMIVQVGLIVWTCADTKAQHPQRAVALLCNTVLCMVISAVVLL